MTDTRMNPSRIIGLQFSLLSPEEIRKGSVAKYCIQGYICK